MKLISWHLIFFLWTKIRTLPLNFCSLRGLNLFYQCPERQFLCFAWVVCDVTPTSSTYCPPWQSYQGNPWRTWYKLRENGLTLDEAASLQLLSIKSWTRRVVFIAHLASDGFDTLVNNPSERKIISYQVHCCITNCFNPMIMFLMRIIDEVVSLS